MKSVDRSPLSGHRPTVQSVTTVCNNAIYCILDVELALVLSRLPGLLALTQQLRNLRMPRPRSSCSPTSLYRMEGGWELDDYLVSLNSADVRQNDPVQLGDVTGHLVTGILVSDQPQWADHVASLTETAVDLPGLYPFAVLLVPVAPWTYGLTWGAGHHLLDDELIEEGFGLMFGVRRLDSAKVAVMARSALDASGRTVQTSIPGGSDLGSFNLEPYGEHVNRMAGKADLTGLTYHRDTRKPYRIKVGNSLWAPFARFGRDLVNDLKAVSEIVDEPDEDSALRFVAQVRKLDEYHPELPQLEQRLAAGLGGEPDSATLGFAWPAEATHDAERATSLQIKYLGLQGSFVVGTDIELDDLISRFAELPATSRIDELRRARVVACSDEDGLDEVGSQISLRKWITVETTIDRTRYCYHQGEWYRIGEGFVEQIHEQVTALLEHKTNLGFPHWTPTGENDDEHRYCEQVARQPGYLCLDKDLARTPFHPKFELCDLVGPNDELIHIKWLGGAPAASHLFTQALVSAEALRDEREALEQLSDKVTAIDPGRLITQAPDVVVLACAGRKWSAEQLFTLSQVSLLRLDRTLRQLRTRLVFADIPYTPKAQARRERKSVSQLEE